MSSESPVFLPITTVNAAMKALPDSARWALKHIMLVDQGEQLAGDIQHYKAVAVSDGSLKLGLGTAAFVIEGHNGFGRMTGVNKVPGPIKDGDSHRCEVLGLYAIILLVNEVCTLHNVTTGSITIACDNSTSLNIFHPDYFPTTNHANFDLVSASWTLLQESPLQWHPVHVKGHQDDHTRLQSLSRLAQLNVEMDTLAKQYWLHLVTSAPDDEFPYPTCHAIYKEGWQIWEGKEKIVAPSTDNLYSRIQDPLTNQWWVRHGHLTFEGLALTDPTATEAMMQSLPKARR